MKLLEWNSETNPDFNEMCNECLEYRDPLVRVGGVEHADGVTQLREAKVCEGCLEEALKLIRSGDG